jgi:hypothetical protein
MTHSKPNMFTNGCENVVKGTKAIHRRIRLFPHTLTIA